MASSECCSNPPALNPSSGSGRVEKLGGFDTYVTDSPDSKLSALLVHYAFATLPTTGTPKVFIFLLVSNVSAFCSAYDLSLWVSVVCVCVLA